MGTRSRDLILQTAKERRWLNLSCSWLCAFSWQRLSTDNRWMRKEWEHAVLMKTLAVNRFCMLVNNATVIHMMILLLHETGRFSESVNAVPLMILVVNRFRMLVNNATVIKMTFPGRKWKKAKIIIRIGVLSH